MKLLIDSKDLNELKNKIDSHFAIEIKMLDFKYNCEMDSSKYNSARELHSIEVSKLNARRSEMVSIIDKMNGGI